ncbi:MFS transporter [Effusibacillus dendaii]|uniref:MFS transporter n=1 Tax=Effusibacillus dendaii TaxID=2743772 RepID=A0A7I8DDK3_9BACL|nr:MFS transporter [Effusibacillus dendaii]BCJ86896.1 MFS transporter [Effusibacillus dendaii]
MTRTSTLSRPVLLLFIGYAVNYFGTGMTMPFLIVYLHEIRNLSLAAAGSMLSISSAVGLLAAPLAGWAVDRLGSFRILLFSLGIVTVGTISYMLVYNFWSALVSAILSGIGGSSMWNALSAQLGTITGKMNRSRFFGIAYAVQNLGLGIGSGLAGLIVHTDDPSSFIRLFLIDALTYLAFIPILLMARGASGRTANQEAGSIRQEEARGYREILKDRALLAATALNMLLVIFGFSQLNSSFSAWVADQSGAGADITGFAFLANCVGIALVQVPVLRLTANWRRTRSAAMAAIGFMICWGLTAVAGLQQGPWSAVLFITALTVFGIGETFLSPSLAPMVNDLAPESLRGRYNATFNLSWQVGMIAGPALAGLSLQYGSGSRLFLLLAMICGLCAIVAIGMERIVPQAANRGDIE